MCCVIVAQSLISFTGKDMPENLIRKDLQQQVGNLSLVLKDSLLPLIANKNVATDQLQRHFLQARLAYKKLEWATEYFMYSTAKLVNGPPVPEAELASQMIVAPMGLQVVEACIFPQYDSSQKQELIRQLESLLEKCTVFNAYFEHIDISEWQVFDAAKLEVFRIETLGITGYDNSLTRKSMQESAVALESVQKAMSYYYSNGHLLNGLFSRAIAYLRSHQDFDNFDRAAFITQYANPLTYGIRQLHDQLQIKDVVYNRLLRQSAGTLFDENIFDANAYAPELSHNHLSEKIALGEKLFSDPILSVTGDRSCASCHQPEQAFAEGVIKHLRIDTNGVIDRNTPTLINAALQPQQLYDMRAGTLEEQIIDVVHNPKEMHGSLSKAASALTKTGKYAGLFAAAFPERENSTIDSTAIIAGIAAYVRSLVRLNSRFDDYMRGNSAALNAEELNGFNLFMGKAQCATCHFMPLFNGVLPPKFITADAEVLGVPDNTNSKRLDPDLGLFFTLQTEIYAPRLTIPFKYAFKTPTVRDAARTAPYMHNGIYHTLEEVMDFYNKGGGAGIGIAVPNQTLSSDSLHLSTPEIKALVAFIKSLDSK